MAHRRLDILTTGGTIASRMGRPMASGAELVDPLQAFFPDVEICERGVPARVKPDHSRHTADHTGSSGESLSAGASGVVITHGTDTLEETAYFLDLTTGHTGSIVVTGAMRGLDDVAPEGMANLVESCRVALEPSLHDYGVLVVMNDRIHLAREVTKTHSWLLDAFSSPETGPVGYVSAQGVQFTVGPPERARGFYTDLETPVDLIKVCLDSGARLLHAALDTGTKGLVIEGFGHGHLPPGMIEGVRLAIERDIPVVLTTRCLTGGAPRPGTLHNVGFITTDLSGPKARIKLMLALSVTKDRAR